MHLKRRTEMDKFDEYCEKHHYREMDGSTLVVYRMCVFLLPVLLTCVIVFIAAGRLFLSSGGTCTFLSLTGLYCPGCGGTRAFNELIHFHILKSFYYHPFVPYSIFAYLLFTVNSFLYRHNKKCIEKLNPFALIIIGGALIFLNVFFKNAVVLIWGIHLI